MVYCCVGQTMLEYRLYLIQRDGHIAQPPATCELASDDDAPVTVEPSSSIQTESERPTCGSCGIAMWLTHITPHKAEPDTLTFACPVCSETKALPAAPAWFAAVDQR